MINRFLEAGKITATHGIKGEVRVECWCDSPDFFSQFSTLYLDEHGSEKLSVSSRAHKNIALMKIDSVDTVEQAQLLRGKVLYIDRQDANLPENVSFVADIIGMSVVDFDTEVCYGTVSDVFKTGANDVYEMKTQDGQKFYIPAIDEVIVAREYDSERLLIRPMKGLFDDED